MFYDLNRFFFFFFKLQSEPFELRVIVWRTKDVVNMDEITNQNDLYARIYLEGSKPQANLLSFLPYPLKAFMIFSGE